MRESVCYLCLDHLNSLGPHVLEVVEHTQGPLLPHLLHHQVQQDEGASPAHPSTAVDQQGLGLGGRVLLPDPPDEGDERHCIAWNSMIRPGSVVHVCHHGYLSL